MSCLWPNLHHEVSMCKTGETSPQCPLFRSAKFQVEIERLFRNPWISSALHRSHLGRDIKIRGVPSNHPHMLDTVLSVSLVGRIGVGVEWEGVSEASLEPTLHSDTKHLKFYL